jgi:type IV pilus assembly protein PilO
MISNLPEIIRAKKNMLLFIALLMLVNIALVLLINSYLVPENGNLQIRWGELRRKAAVEGRLDVNTLYKQGRADLEKVSERIPAKRQFPALLGEILETADANSLSSGNISYKPETVKGQKLLAYIISMNVSGSYAGIKSFISDLREIKELVVIDKLALSRSEQAGDSVTMILQLTAYLREAP